MRDGIFRGKRLEDGKWIYGYYFEQDMPDGLRSYIRTFQADRFGTDFAVDPATVGQYTGLQDMNSNKVFEWDICNFKYIPNPEYNNPKEYFVTAVVEWSNRNYGYCLHNICPRSKKHPSRKQYFPLGDYRISGLTIVGIKEDK